MRNRQGCLAGLLELFFLDRAFGWLERRFGSDVVVRAAAAAAASSCLSCSSSSLFPYLLIPVGFVHSDARMVIRCDHFVGDHSLCGDGPGSDFAGYHRAD